MFDIGYEPDHNKYNHIYIPIKSKTQHNISMT